MIVNIFSYKSHGSLEISLPKNKEHLAYSELIFKLLNLSDLNSQTQNMNCSHA